MEDDVDILRHPLHGRNVVAVRLLELDAFGKILEVATDHVVAANNLVAESRVRIGEVTAKKPGYAGYENSQILLHSGTVRAVTPRKLICPGPPQHRGNRAEENADIEPEGPLLDVLAVEVDDILEIEDRAPAADLP